MRELLAELTAALTRRLPCVYCAVVETRGSTPQKAGAAMLAYADGTQAGTLGGGCVEAEVKRRALHALASDPGGPRLHPFLLDEDYGWDDGLICGGRMTILAEPLGPAAAPHHRRRRELLDAGQGFTEVVALPENTAGVPAGARYLFDANGMPAGVLGGPPAPAAVTEQL